MSEIDKTTGEVITPEQTVAETGEPTVTVDSLKALHEEEKKGLVAQVIDLRKKLQEEKALKAIAPPEPTGDDLESKVKSILFLERKTEQEISKKKALREFWGKHPEFNPENDITGVRGEQLMEQFKRLNTSNSSAEDTTKDLEDALYLMRGETQTKVTDTNRFASTSTSGANSTPRETASNKLTAEQEALRKEKGWTVEKYLAMKAKYPAVVL